MEEEAGRRRETASDEGFFETAYTNPQQITRMGDMDMNMPVRKFPFIKTILEHYRYRSLHSL